MPPWICSGRAPGCISPHGLHRHGPGPGEWQPQPAHDAAQLSRSIGHQEDSVYLCSPDTGAAAALTGQTTDPRDLPELFGLEYPPFALPAVSSVNLAMLEKPLPPEESIGVHLVKGENISSLPIFELLSEHIEAPVALIVGDDISTDEILPAGARVLPFRSNVPKLTEFTFDQVDPTRAALTRDTTGHARQSPHR